MSQGIGWVPYQAGLTLLVYLAQFFILEVDLVDTSENIFVVIGKFLVFADAGLPAWFSVVLFTMVTLPWVLLITSYFTSNLATTIVGLIGAGVAGIVALFAGLFS